MSIIFIFKFQSRIRQMTDKISQELFLDVKERLDYYHLPTTFPIEATPLLSKLIKLVDGNQRQHQTQSLPAPLVEGLSTALRHQMGHVVKENNKLHMDLIVARQEIQSLQHRLYKGEANKHSQVKEAEKVCALKGQRQLELTQELTAIKYKYNELMDFLHEDPKAEREYIKRLMKHRREPIGNKESEEHNGARQSSPGRDKTHSSQRIKQLQAKVNHREAEILRLQNLIQYDGMDMNKIIKRFQDSLTDNKLKVADSKINFLEQSLEKATRENNTMKNNNGSKEALRIQVQKCHKIIQSLKKENKQLKRNNQEQSFDFKKQIDQQQRKVTKAKEDKHQLEIQSNHRQQVKNQLAKKVSFLEKETQESRQELESTRKQKNNAQEGRSQLQKNNESLRVFYEYEIETFKKKLQEVQFQLHESKAALKRSAHQSDILRREGDVKTQSIANLQKIVNELLKKNSLLSDNTLGTLQNLKRSEDVETKRQLIDLQQQLIYAQNQRQQLDNDRKTIEQRFAVAIRDNQRFKADLSYLKNDIVGKENLIIQLTNELQDLKFVHKKTQAELARFTSQLAEITQHKTSFQENLRQQNERLLSRERALRSQLKEAEIKLSEEQGTLDITRIKLAEREERIKHIERLLNETVEQSKILSSRVTELEDQTHDLARQKHRITKKYEQTRKQAQDFKNGSFKNYEAAINDDINERNRLKQQIRRLADAQQRLQIRYDQVNGLLNLVRREKELQQVEKIDLQRQVQHLQIRLLEMQQIERALVIQNQNIRNVVRRI